MSSSVDVAIIGAGAAGLAAARTARALGLEFVVLEAKHRIGGRTWTESDSLGVPFDRGAHWLHAASLNPFTALARSYGFTTAPGPRLRTHTGERWCSSAEEKSRIRAVDGYYDAIDAAGERGLDVAVADVLAADGRWRRLFDEYCAADFGVSPAQQSTLDDWTYEDTDENWTLREGYGALVARHSEGVPVTLGTAVTSIDWSRNKVRVATSDGVLKAKTVVVTVSTGVLRAGGIEFTPELPDWKLEAIEALPMGGANRVGLLYDRKVFDVAPDLYVYLDPAASVGGDPLGFEIRPFGQDMAVGYVAGELAEALETQGEAALIAHAEERLAAIFGSSAARHRVAATATAWMGDPHTLGAYSAALPGRALRRSDLARPLADRLFFAGEATSLDAYSTVHGANESGIDAVEEIDVTLGNEPAFRADR